MSRNNKYRRGSKSVRKMRGRIQACELEMQSVREVVEHNDRKVASLNELVNSISVTNQRVARLFTFVDNLVAKLSFWRKK